MNWELERNFVDENFVDPNSSIGDKFGVGVTGSTPPNPSVEGIILADGSSIHASNAYEDGTEFAVSTGSKGSSLLPRSNILVNDNIESKQQGSDKGSVLPNSSIGDNSGVGVTGFTPPNPSVGGILLADGSSIHASNTYGDSAGSKGSSLPPRLNILVIDNIGSKQAASDKGSVLPNSSIGDNSGVGVTGFTPPNPSVGGTILADGCSIHASNTYENSTGTCALSPSTSYGVAVAIKDRIPAVPSKGRVIIIGVGLAGLAAARQLMSFGFKVTVLEGRKRAGGRVYTRKMEGRNKVAAADLGGSVLTCTLGNPLGLLTRQLSYTLHKVRDECPLYRANGKPVDKDLDQIVEVAYNMLLDKASKLRQGISEDVSLGAALETSREVSGDTMNDEEMSLFNWHLANLEFANAGLLSNISLAFWDQDDPYDKGGDHCLPGGNGRLVQALAENVCIMFEKTVHAIRYGSDSVQVYAGAEVFEGEMASCTVPLGVLKSGSVKFIPELPQRKLDAIKRLGFGLGSSLPPRSNILVNDNIESKQQGSDKGSVLPNSSIGDNSGVGVTGFTPPNPSVGGILLADGSSIHASNTYGDSAGTCASSLSANCGGW
ncbi:hypothetical protein K7X08_017156 [Anisodus acutangulus]|uniref:Amine oxidase domain-containing protein n=1 Tax=Anisodus acutangulus TaxID=402998 RepID=A0A9Q1LSW9_9SOLA|nr:hypothetical protein K7X08_017156 [Anisodus acutangulus]